MGFDSPALRSTYLLTIPAKSEKVVVTGVNGDRHRRFSRRAGGQPAFLFPELPESAVKLQPASGPVPV